MSTNEDEFSEWARAFSEYLSDSTEAKSLSACLQQASDGRTDPEFRRVLAAVHDTVIQGNPLSAAFAQHPDVFPEAFITSVRYGEIYGEVDLTLRRYVERPEERAVRCPIPSYWIRILLQIVGRAVSR